MAPPGGGAVMVGARARGDAACRVGSSDWMVGQGVGVPSVAAAGPAGGGDGCIIVDERASVRSGSNGDNTARTGSVVTVPSGGRVGTEADSPGVGTIIAETFWCARNRMVATQMMPLIGTAINKMMLAIQSHRPRSLAGCGGSEGGGAPPPGGVGWPGSSRSRRASSISRCI